MSRRFVAFSIIFLIVAAFIGILTVNSQRINRQLLDNTRITTSPLTPTSSLASTPYPTEMVFKQDTTQAFHCSKDSDCGTGKCVEKTMCPPCLDNDPYAKCTCVTTKTCQHTSNPCTSYDTLDVNTGAPFKPSIQEAREYFQKNNMVVDEEKTQIIGENNGYYVVRIPPTASGDAWISKMKQDGFTDVTYHIIIGCDEIGY